MPPQTLAVALHTHCRRTGTGSDASAFTNALQGRNSAGQRVPGWNVYNSDHPAAWEKMPRDGIHQMQRNIPIYVADGTK